MGAILLLLFSVFVRFTTADDFTALARIKLGFPDAATGALRQRLFAPLLQIRCSMGGDVYISVL